MGDSLPRVIKFILFLVLFVIFFEAGLISSYTIVTQQPPDVGGLIDVQLGSIAAFLEKLNLNSSILGSPDKLTILNEDQVAEALKAKAKLDGINMGTLQAFTYEDSGNDVITVNIAADGYRDVTVQSGGQIVISPGENYSVVATAKAETRERGVEVDISTIKITSFKRLYNRA